MYLPQQLNTPKQQQNTLQPWLQHVRGLQCGFSDVCEFFLLETETKTTFEKSQTNLAAADAYLMATSRIINEFPAAVYQKSITRDMRLENYTNRRLPVTQLEPNVKPPSPLLCRNPCLLYRLPKMHKNNTLNQNPAMKTYTHNNR